jgi:hypothetical protein
VFGWSDGQASISLAAAAGRNARLSLFDKQRPQGIVYAQIISAKTKEVTMWATEHSVETSAAPEAIWRL